jgi:hypothetical protein
MAFRWLAIFRAEAREVGVEMDNSVGVRVDAQGVASVRVDGNTMRNPT